MFYFTDIFMLDKNYTKHIPFLFLIALLLMFSSCSKDETPMSKSVGEEKPNLNSEEPTIMEDDINFS